MGLFEWYSDLHTTSPLLAGAFIPFYFAALGLAFATVADVAVKLTGIHLGDYKKEYDEILDEQESATKAK